MSTTHDSPKYVTNHCNLVKLIAQGYSPKAILWDSWGTDKKEIS